MSDDDTTPHGKQPLTPVKWPPGPSMRRREVLLRARHRDRIDVMISMSAVFAQVMSDLGRLPEDHVRMSKAIVIAIEIPEPGPESWREAIIIAGNTVAILDCRPTRDLSDSDIVLEAERFLEHIEFPHSLHETLVNFEKAKEMRHALSYELTRKDV